MVKLWFRLGDRRTSLLSTYSILPALSLTAGTVQKPQPAKWSNMNVISQTWGCLFDNKCSKNASVVHTLQERCQDQVRKREKGIDEQKNCETAIKTSSTEKYIK